VVTPITVEQNSSAFEQRLAKYGSSTPSPRAQRHPRGSAGASQAEPQECPGQERRHPPRESASQARTVTVEELAQFLQVPVATVYAWNHKRTGPPAAKVGRHLRYQWEDVDRWLRSRTAGGAETPGSGRSL
jgi:excisionase family DNA binding protein